MSTTPSLNATPPLGSNAGSIQVSEHKKTKTTLLQTLLLKN
jgi:hypothetical protein